MYLANSRGAWAALALGLLATYVRRPWIIAGAVFLIFAAVTARLGSSDIQRVQIWYSALTQLSLAGNGAGSFLSLWFSTPTSLVHPEFVHNDFLQFVFEYGVGAILLFVILGACACCVQAQQWPVFIAFLFMACFSFPFLCAVPALIGAICAGRIAGDWNYSWRLGVHRRHAFVSRISTRKPEPSITCGQALPA